MITALSAALFRWRRPILLAGAAVAMPLAMVAYRWPIVSGLLLAMMIPPCVTAIVVAMVINRRRTRSFDVGRDVPLFGTPLLGSSPLFAVCGLFLAAALMPAAVTGIRAGEDRWSWVAGLTVLAGLGASVVRPAWSGCGVRLRPAGIEYDGPACTAVLPWEALDEAAPVEAVDRFAVRLRCARPDLVRFAGIALDRRTIRFDGADPRFVAAAITHYVTHPGQRAEIGTPAGLRRLRDAVDGAPAAPGLEAEGPPPGWIGIGVAAAVCVAAFLAPVGSAPHWGTWVTTGIAALALGYAVDGAWARLRRRRRKKV